MLLHAGCGPWALAAGVAGALSYMISYIIMVLTN